VGANTFQKVLKDILLNKQIRNIQVWFQHLHIINLIQVCKVNNLPNNRKKEVIGNKGMIMVEKVIWKAMSLSLVMREQFQQLDIQEKEVKEKEIHQIQLLSSKVI
jgi:hypothetical protein